MGGKMWIRAAAAAMTLGCLPSCDEFYDVIVPAVDTTAPIAATGVWQHQVYLDLTGGGATPSNYEIDFYEDYVLVAAGIDDGGTKKITFEQEYETLCTRGGLGQTMTGRLVPIVATQPGGVGQTVSNGLWTGRFVRLSDYSACRTGWTLASVAFHYRAIAEDFKGNTSTHGWATVYGWP